MQDIAQKFALATGDKGVSLTTHLDPKGLFVCGDIGMIERVFTNLIDNAIRYTLGGGQIRIEAARAQEVIRVQVVDNGARIAVVSELGRGTSFSFALPAARPS